MMERAVAEPGGAMEFFFQPADRCRVDDLTGAGDCNRSQGRQLPADNRLVENANLFFGIARQAGKAVAWVRCSRIGHGKHYFRIRGLRTRQEFRNRGIGSVLLGYAVGEMLTTHGGDAVYSFILPENTVSIRIHERAGFCRVVPPFPAPERHLCYGIRAGDYKKSSTGV
jgi:GNAT superfamily N-acetyltransferase